MGRSGSTGPAVSDELEGKRLYTRREAAVAMSMSLDTFERYVQPYIPLVMVGRLVQIAPASLDKWIADNSHTVRP